MHLLQNSFLVTHQLTLQGTKFCDKNIVNQNINGQIKNQEYKISFEKNTKRLKVVDSLNAMNITIMKCK